MTQSQNYAQLGRFISLVLRHNPSAAGITLDENGWADTRQLLAGMNSHGRRIDMTTLERIVQQNNKQRYSFNQDRTKIRANQGHSIDVDVELTPSTPPSVLYHGTAEQFLHSIQQQGITRQLRQYVHLSADVSSAISVGKRHGRAVVLRIDAAAMVRDGFSFWLSANGVWLCSEIPWRYASVEANIP